ncbi:hypothetical protein [Bacillus salipaludis]|uniref:Homeodomain phBC6A51-type domain-containing protein n=1 Tax=Bacillus salipaludis TaxID=2547811 RepID=A0ABW8RB83_9BACI
MEIDYKGLVEKKFGKPLKEIMYEICIEKGLEKWDGAELLGVPVETFAAWRSKFRFGPLQWRADQAAILRKKNIEKYNEELLNSDLNRVFVHKGERTIESFKEVIERMLELAKAKRTKHSEVSLDEISILMKIGILENTLEYINDFEKNKLHEKFERELELYTSFTHK